MAIIEKTEHGEIYRGYLTRWDGQLVPAAGECPRGEPCGIVHGRGNDQDKNMLHLVAEREERRRTLFFGGSPCPVCGIKAAAPGMERRYCTHERGTE